MTHTLRNKHLEITVDDPLENYQASRFDWTGKISEVKFQGMPMTITEKNDDQDENLFGKGLYNEFSMDTALGFEEAEIGDWFHKIGIGLLKKDSPDYEFFKEYEIKPAAFDVVVEANSVIIECISETINGYAYRLLKSIILDDDQLIIKYELENTGECEFEAEEYVHNFVAINGELVNTGYHLKFPFLIKSEKSSQTVNPDMVLDFQNTDVKFNGSTTNQFFSSYLNGDNKVEAQWELIHQDQKIGIRETTSFPTEKVNLWGWKHVISPELFHNIHLKAGQCEEWSRSYQFFKID